MQSATQTTDDFSKLRNLVCDTEASGNLHIFLLKQIYHNLGSDSLNMIDNSNCKWLLPTLGRVNKVRMLIV